ncbi:MAG: helix-turn-helix domain-containing protein [Rhodoglobus sp.]
MDEVEIGAAVKLRRRALGLTQADLAALAETDRDTISALEKGRGTRLATLLRTAAVLGLSVKVGDTA